MYLNYVLYLKFGTIFAFQKLKTPYLIHKTPFYPRFDIFFLIYIINSNTLFLNYILYLNMYFL